jgi:hypothetical protein
MNLDVRNFDLSWSLVLILFWIFATPTTRDDCTWMASQFPPSPTNSQIILSSPSLLFHDADFLVLLRVPFPFNPVVNSVLPKSVCILLKISFHTLFALRSISYFYFWYFISSWNQYVFYIVIDFDIRGSVFMAVLSVSVNNKYWDSDVSNRKLLTRFRAHFKRCPSLKMRGKYIFIYCIPLWD